VYAVELGSAANTVQTNHIGESFNCLREQILNTADREKNAPEHKKYRERSWICLALEMSTSSQVPYMADANHHAQWIESMQKEITTLEMHGTWDEVAISNAKKQIQDLSRYFLCSRAFFALSAVFRINEIRVKVEAWDETMLIDLGQVDVTLSSVISITSRSLLALTHRGKRVPSCRTFRRTSGDRGVATT
jgi:desulfoferrodoxin (superoxide reductase-like protein)